MQQKSGFTLVEILLVIGIIAVLATVVIVALDPAKRFQDSPEGELEILSLQAVFKRKKVFLSLEIDINNLLYHIKRMQSDIPEESDRVRFRLRGELRRENSSKTDVTKEHLVFLLLTEKNVSLTKKPLCEGIRLRNRTLRKKIPSFKGLRQLLAEVSPHTRDLNING
jgi:prepilin-type N-terminal cleavage/methylation domain-containing protein